MSWETNAWVLKQRLRMPHASHLLLLISNASDPEGMAFKWWKRKDHWINYLIEHSGLSRATVFRYLNWLEEQGLIARQTVVMGDGTNRFELECQMDKIVIREPDDDDEAAPQSQPETQSESQPETENPDSESQSCDSRDVPSKIHSEDNISPQTPLTAPKGDQGSETRIEPDLTGLDAFRETYPRPSSRPEADADLWASLSPQQRAQAQHGANGARLIFAKNPKSSGVVGPTRFLQSEPLWAEYGRFAPAAKAPPPPRIFVVKGSEEWRARTVLHALTARPMPAASFSNEHGCLGADFLGRLPQAGLVLERFADQFGNVDAATWVELHATAQGKAEPTEKERLDRPKIAAWIERVAECTGITIAPGLIYTEGYTEHTDGAGKAFKAQRRFFGIRVPAPWPPAKHATDPPKESSAA